MVARDPAVLLYLGILSLPQFVVFVVFLFLYIVLAPWCFVVYMHRAFHVLVDVQL